MIVVGSLMIGITLLLVGYMQYQFSKTPAKTKAYLKYARKMNNRVIEVVK